MKVQWKWFAVEFKYTFPPFGHQYLIINLPSNPAHYCTVCCKVARCCAFTKAISVINTGSLLLKVRFQRQFICQFVQKYIVTVVTDEKAEKQLNISSPEVYAMFITRLLLYCLMSSTLISIIPVDFSTLPLSTSSQAPRHTGCPRRNVPDFGRVFLMLKYTDITQNTYVQSWTVTEIMAREVWKYNSCYTLIDYQIHIKTGRNMWFL